MHEVSLLFVISICQLVRWFFRPFSETNRSRSRGNRHRTYPNRLPINQSCIEKKRPHTDPPTEGYIYPYIYTVEEKKGAREKEKKGRQGKRKGEIRKWNGGEKARGRGRRKKEGRKKMGKEKGGNGKRPSILSICPFYLSFLSVLSICPFCLSFLSVLSVCPFLLYPINAETGQQIFEKQKFNFTN